VLESFAEPVVGPRGVLVEGIRASAGVAIAADPGEVADALVRADLAMYTAKSEGGSSVVLDASVVVDEGRHRAARSEVKAGAPHAED
jgi:GGDEF domain-containing protein